MFFAYIQLMGELVIVSRRNGVDTALFEGDSLLKKHHRMNAAGTCSKLSPFIRVGAGVVASNMNILDQFGATTCTMRHHPASHKLTRVIVVNGTLLVPRKLDRRDRVNDNGLPICKDATMSIVRFYSDFERMWPSLSRRNLLCKDVLLRPLWCISQMMPIRLYCPWLERLDS
ncbi:uncharacterized protein CLUP02_05424 [Colletotrichum lupini]|uniref:Uncharacterized protein n=1 Tax=Colletotrichum lupini TaxID=145971 RepID=A0A9Q8WDP6_9PEZI|nr:uncharacterized protein CLUP02_05424 [Colletotrichum lupini]UQC79943.1 hypothetical protein CLUP02_05424 [Colletotrichum lupini]